jgi:nucleoside-diphosphate-sugar epimerase
MTNLRDEAAHRNVDKIILEAGEKEGVKAAIVCPPTIYGVARGPGNKRSQQLHNLSRIILTDGAGRMVGEGNRQTHVHVEDLSNLYVVLIEAEQLEAGMALGERMVIFSSVGEQVSHIFIQEMKISL